MWLSQLSGGWPRSRDGAEVGTVTLAGDPAGVYLSGERRCLPVFAPGGYYWRPALGEQVLVLKFGGEGESLCVVGTRGDGPEDLEPGELCLRGPGGGEIRLCADGTVAITGQLTVNGEAFPPESSGAGLGV